MISGKIPSHRASSASRSWSTRQAQVEPRPLPLHVPRARPWPAPPLLAVRLGGPFLDRDLDEALGPAVPQDRLDGLSHLGPLAVSRPRRGQLLPQLGQARQSPLDPLVPRQRRRVRPCGCCDTRSAGTPRRWSSPARGPRTGPPARPSSSSLSWTCRQRAWPSRIAPRKAASSAAGAGQDAEESAAVLVEVGHVLRRSPACSRRRRGSPAGRSADRATPRSARCERSSVALPLSTRNCTGTAPSRVTVRM